MSTKKTRICIHAEPYWDNEKNWWFGKFCQKFSFKIFEKSFFKNFLKKTWKGSERHFTLFLVTIFFMKFSRFLKTQNFVHLTQNLMRFINSKSHGHTSCILDVVFQCYTAAGGVRNFGAQKIMKNAIFQKFPYFNHDTTTWKDVTY